MFLLNSGANPNNGQNRQKLSKEETRLKIIKGFLVFFVFVLLMGTTLWSVQWFSESLRGFLFWDTAPAPGVFSGSLETSAISILEPATGTDTTAPETSSGGDTINDAEVVLAPVKENLVMPETGEAPKPASLASEPKSFISVEVKDGRENLLASKAENEALPVASVTKLMTALISLEQYDILKKIIVNEGR